MMVFFAGFMKWLTEKKVSRKIRAVVVHHTAKPPAATWKRLGTEAIVDSIRTAHKKRGYSDIGYHVLIMPDGTIVVGREINKRGAHAKDNKGNVGTVGVVFVGNFETEDPKQNGYDTGVKVVAALLNKFGLHATKETMLFHRQLTRTACPGKKLGYNEFLLDVQQELAMRNARPLTLLVNGKEIPGAEAVIVGGVLYTYGHPVDLELQRHPSVSELMPLLASKDIEQSGRIALRPFLWAKGFEVTHVENRDGIINVVTKDTRGKNV